MSNRLMLRFFLGASLALSGCVREHNDPVDSGLGDDAFAENDAGDTDAGEGADGGVPDTCAEPARGSVIGAGSVTAGAANHYLLRGRVVSPDVVFAPGEVLISGDRIVCVDTDCSSHSEASDATVVETAGVIYPGIVDAHNHTQYNYLPIWVPNPPGLFQNRGDWAARNDYSDFTASVNDNESAHVCQQVKYGELRALVGGTTTIQGTFNSNRRCFRTLVNNAEYGPFGTTDRMRTNITGVDAIDAMDATTISGQMASGDVTAYVIHLGEGIDEESRAEFDTLVEKNLLAAQTVVIHGTAFGATEFAMMGAAGAKLVWSPFSNLLLYGGTTNVPAALDAGVSVSLAPDWTPSGSVSLLQEMRVARRHSCENWDGRLTNEDLVKMVTSIPAHALALDDQVGTLAPGLAADVLVIADRGGDAYAELVNAQMQDIRMVFLSGIPRYGDAALMAATPRTACEAFSMCGSDKFICVPDNTDGTDTLNESLMSIQSTIEMFYPGILPLEACEG
ncbi:MAG: amidohydrolase family protein [Sandaracinaceae bacterium]|nr:amidohydrolase family protein [Sandaracinaceae bacterium]